MLLCGSKSAGAAPAAATSSNSHPADARAFSTPSSRRRPLATMAAETQTELLLKSLITFATFDPITQTLLFLVFTWSLGVDKVGLELSN